MGNQETKNLGSLEDISNEMRSLEDSENVKLSKELKLVDDIIHKVNDHELIRPFRALAYMTEKKRNNIRKTLEFKWDKKTEYAEKDLKKYFEAWEILNRNIKGIISRMHTRYQQINPRHYSSWRKTLRAILTLTNTTFDAAADEEEIELTFLQVFGNQTQVPKRPASQLSADGIKSDVAPLVAGAKIVGPKILGAIAVAGGIGGLIEKALGSEDEPAINSIFAICLFIHNQKRK